MNAYLATLPVDDDWPPLCRAMFSTTGDDTAHGSYGDRRLIHFASHFDYFDQSFDRWLTKFEGLLRRLYWVSAEVFLLHCYSVYPFCIRYLITPEVAENYRSPQPRPPRTWEVSGYRVELTEPPEGDFVSTILPRRRPTGADGAE